MLRRLLTWMNVTQSLTIQWFDCQLEVLGVSMYCMYSSFCPLFHRYLESHLGDYIHLILDEVFFFFLRLYVENRENGKVWESGWGNRSRNSLPLNLSLSLSLCCMSTYYIYPYVSSLDFLLHFHVCAVCGNVCSINTRLSCSELCREGHCVPFPVHMQKTQRNREWERTPQWLYLTDSIPVQQIENAFSVRYVAYCIMMLQSHTFYITLP